MKSLAALASIAILASLTLTGTAYASTSLSSSNQWVVYGQTTLPSGSMVFSPIAHGSTFSLPDATATSPAFVNYMLNTYQVPLTEANTLTATFTLTTSTGSTTLIGDTFGGFNLATPAYVRLFLQANLPDDGTATCVGGNSNVENYWWADFSSYTFTPGGSGGVITMTASLNNANWSGICGNFASANPTGFDAALANTHLVGLSFGSGYFYASGVGVDGTTGTATFSLTSFSIS